MAFGGAALKFLQTFLYALAFCCSGIILGIYSYFLAVQADRNSPIPRGQQAVEGISGAAVVYTIFAVVLTCCLGGKRFFALLAIVLDVLFVGAFIALAVLTRDGASSCTGDVNTPLGNGAADTRGSFGDNGFGTSSGENVTYQASLRTACRMNTACFAVAIVGAFVFLLAAILQVWLARHHKREKRFGPSPANGYTVGTASVGGSKWFNRRRRGHKTHHNKDVEVASIGAGGLAVPVAANGRHSHDTAYTGTTAGHDGTFLGNKHEPAQTHLPGAAGYHTGPTGTAVNPYGTTGTAANY